MKKAVVFLILFCTILCGCSGYKKASIIDKNVDMTPRLISLADGLETSSMIEQVSSAVVGISVTLRGGVGIGSGVAVADQGYILTNQHVINGAKEIRVYFADKTDAKASLI